MNVDTSSSAATEVSTASNTSQAKSSNSAKKTEESSFDKELKAAESSEKKDEKVTSKDSNKSKSDSKVSEKNNDKNANENSDDLMFGLNTSINFTDFKYHNESQNLLTKNIQELINTRSQMSVNGFNNASSSLKASISYTDNSMEMSDGDALFFSDLVKNSDNMSMQSIGQQIQMASEQSVEKTAKSAQVSSVLMEKLSESLKTNQPFRIDFDKDVSVIIKVNKDGSLMANFIPGDKAVEQYLKNNISFLRQRFDEQNLSYSDLSYSNSRQQQQEEQRRRNNKENGHE